MHLEAPHLPVLFFHPVGGEGREEWRDQENFRERLGVIEERWKQLSINNLCYVARMEDMEIGGHGNGDGGMKKWRSILSLSPIARWV